jgi:ornithine--oxo-acid transaminase
MLMNAIELERRHGARNYDPLPVEIERGEGVWLYDRLGRRYLDMMSAYSAVSHGHCHPRIVAAAVAQLSRVAIVSRAYHASALGPFLAKLSEVTGFECALPMNTGAEAVETAIKAVRRWGYRVRGIAPERAQILVARNNFHGRTTTVISASTEADYRRDFGPFTPGFTHFDFGDIESVRAAIGRHTCAVLVEPIQGEAGIVLPPDGFLGALRNLCDEHQVLLVLDEVQSGLGRTGRMFAFQHEGIRPDGLILGKALGGGLLPVSAFCADRALMDKFEPGSHGSTFGGNPLAATVALEALRVLEEEDLVGNSARLGDYLRTGLEAIRSPLMRAVRGRGLWVGVEIDVGRVSARRLCEALISHGVLSKDTHETVVRFAPPLVITQEQIDWGLERIAAAFRECELARAA